MDYRGPRSTVDKNLVPDLAPIDADNSVVVRWGRVVWSPRLPSQVICRCIQIGT
jgi:hypothetical protein